jgi:hypothetical protein
MQPVEASSNRKTETRQPKEPEESSSHTKAKPDSRSHHSIHAAGLSDIESGVSGPKSVPRGKTRAKKRVSRVQRPLSPATPQVRPRPGKANVDVSYLSKTIIFSSDNVTPAGASEVAHTRRTKRKRVVESEDEGEPKAKKPKSETPAVERATSPRQMGSTFKIRPNAAKANSHHKTSPTLIDAHHPGALEAEQVKPPATAKRVLKIRSPKANMAGEKAKRLHKVYSPPQNRNDQSSTLECERVLEWDCRAFA